MERLSTQRAGAGTVTFLKPLRLSFQEQNTQQRPEPTALYFDHVPVKVRDVEIQHVQPRNQLSPVQTEGTAFHSVLSAGMARVCPWKTGGDSSREGSRERVRALPLGSGRHSAHWVEEQGKTARNLLFSLHGDLLPSLAWVQLLASPQWPPCPPDFLPLLPPCSREL